MEDDLIKLICGKCEIEFYMKTEDSDYATYCPNCGTLKIKVA